MRHKSHSELRICSTHPKAVPHQFSAENIENCSISRYLKIIIENLAAYQGNPDNKKYSDSRKVGDTSAG